MKNKTNRLKTYGESSSNIPDNYARRIIILACCLSVLYGLKQEEKGERACGQTTNLDIAMQQLQNSFKYAGIIAVVKCLIYIVRKKIYRLL